MGTPSFGLARNGLAGPISRCPLTEVEQKSATGGQTDANDPGPGVMKVSALASGNPPDRAPMLGSITGLTPAGQAHATTTAGWRAPMGPGTYGQASHRRLWPD